MTRDETAVMLYVDGDVGRLVAVERALAHQGASVATAVSAVHMGRLLQRTPTVRIAAVDANSVDVVAIAVLLARAETDVGLVVLTDEPEQRARLARERGVVAVFSRQGSADAIASRVRSALAVPSIERVTLSTILRLAAAVRATFTLRIDSSDALSQTHGVIWVDNGQIVHAELGDLVGANAVVAMLAQKERAIGLERETRAKMRTVHFDIDVFLSSFDLPDDEPEIELVDDGLSATSLSAARLRAHEVSENDGTFGVLAVSGAIDGVVSAGLLDARSGNMVARIGIPQHAGVSAEAALWTAMAGSAARTGDSEIEDAVCLAGGDAFVFVPLADARTRIICLHVDAHSTNVALARLEARRIAAVEPGLHDLVLTFGATKSEHASTS